MKEANFEMMLMHNKSLEDDPNNTTAGADNFAKKNATQNQKVGAGSAVKPAGAASPAASSSSAIGKPTISSISSTTTDSLSSSSTTSSGSSIIGSKTKNTGYYQYSQNATATPANMTKKEGSKHNKTLGMLNISSPFNKSAERNYSSQEFGWPIRKDDSYPYAQDKWQYWSGYYSSRILLKQNIKKLVATFHSGLRLLSQ